MRPETEEEMDAALGHDDDTYISDGGFVVPDDEGEEDAYSDANFQAIKDSGQDTQSHQRGIDDSTGSEAMPQEYGVEKILTHREENGKREYYTKWEGYTDLQDCTWEPLASFASCLNLVADYDATARAKSTVGAKVKAQLPPANSAKRKNKAGPVDTALIGGRRTNHPSKRLRKSAKKIVLSSESEDNLPTECTDDIDAAQRRSKQPTKQRAKQSRATTSKRTPSRSVSSAGKSPARKCTRTPAVSSETSSDECSSDPEFHPNTPVKTNWQSKEQCSETEESSFSDSSSECSSTSFIASDGSNASSTAVNWSDTRGQRPSRRVAVHPPTYEESQKQDLREKKKKSKKKSKKKAKKKSKNAKAPRNVTDGDGVLRGSKRPSKKTKGKGASAKTTTAGGKKAKNRKGATAETKTPGCKKAHKGKKRKKRKKPRPNVKDGRGCHSAGAKGDQYEVEKILRHRIRKGELQYKIKWIGWEEYAAFVSHLDLGHAPYDLYGVKYIDLVSLGAFAPRYFLFSHRGHVMCLGTAPLSHTLT